MKAIANAPFHLDVPETQAKLLQSGTAVSEVFSTTARNIQLIQSNAGAELFTRSLESLAPAFSPAGGSYCFQHLPEFYTTQATAMVKAATDTFGELLRAQQTLMEMGSQSSWKNAQESADSTTQTLTALYRRRQTRQVIQFPERRVDRP